MSIPSVSIWIILPLIWSVLLIFLAYFRRAQWGLAVVGSLILAWVAWVIPVDEVITLGESSFKIVETYEFLGREFVLSSAHQPFLLGLYLMVFLWLFVSIWVQPGGRFAPMVFAIIALLTAALAVRPFLYAALLIEIAVLLSIPLLIEPGRGAKAGVLRFLAFQTLGMPFILFTGWVLAGVEASPGNLDLVVQTGVLLGIGFSFLLAVFPFHSWIPLLFEESRPYTASFVVVMVLGIIAVFGLTFLDRYVWVRDAEILYTLLRGIGAVMVLTGGVWIAVEKNMARMLGYALVLETGMFLLAVGLGNSIGITLFFALFLPRIVSVIVWAASLEFFYKDTGGDLNFSAWQGRAGEFPLVTFTLLFAHFSLAGFPGLSGFPFRLILWQNLSFLYPMSAAAALLGTIGFLVGGIRTLQILILAPTDEEASDSEGQISASVPESGSELSPEEKNNRNLVAIFIGFSALMSVVVGLFPHQFLPFIEKIVNIFERLGN